MTNVVKLHRINEDAEEQVCHAWRAVESIRWLEPRDLRDNIQAIAEMQEALEYIMERAMS